MTDSTSHRNLHVYLQSCVTDIHRWDDYRMIEFHRARRAVGRTLDKLGTSHRAALLTTSVTNFPCQKDRARNAQSALTSWWRPWPHASHPSFHHWHTRLECHCWLRASAGSVLWLYRYRTARQLRYGLCRQLRYSLWSSDLISSVQDGIYVLGKAHMRSAPSLRGFPNVVFHAFETVPLFVWLTMALSRPLKEDRLALPLSTPLSSRRSMVWCPWLCARR